MNNLIIKLLFKLLKVDSKTKDLVLFEDLERLRGSSVTTRVKKNVEDDWQEAQATVFNQSKFIEWLYFQVVVKQRSCALEENKNKRIHRRAEMIFILWLINHLREADEEQIRKKNK